MQSIQDMFIVEDKELVGINQISVILDKIDTVMSYLIFGLLG